MLDGAHPAVHGERDDLGRVGVGANVAAEGLRFLDSGSPRRGCTAGCLLIRRHRPEHRAEPSLMSLRSSLYVLHMFFPHRDHSADSATVAAALP